MCSCVGNGRFGIQTQPFFPIGTQKPWSKERLCFALSFFMLFAFFSTLGSSSVELNGGFQLSLDPKGPC